MRPFLSLAGVLLGAAILIPGALGQAQPLRLVSPQNGAVVSGTVAITAEAVEDLDVSFVVFGIDGERPVATNSRPFTCSWDTSAYADGPHILFIEAHGPGGMAASAGPIRVIVRNRPVVARVPTPRGPVAARVIPAPSPRVSLLDPPRRGPVPEVTVSMDGAPFRTPVTLIEDEAYLPVRPLVERLNGQANWDQGSRTVTLVCRGHEAMLTVGSTYGTLDGDSIRFWRPPTLDNGRTILGARSCARLLDLTVAWDQVRRVIQMGFDSLRSHPEANGGPA